MLWDPAGGVGRIGGVARKRACAGRKRALWSGRARARAPTDVSASGKLLRTCKARQAMEEVFDEIRRDKTRERDRWERRDRAQLQKDLKFLHDVLKERAEERRMRESEEKFQMERLEQKRANEIEQKHQEDVSGKKQNKVRMERKTPKPEPKEQPVKKKQTHLKQKQPKKEVKVRRAEPEPKEQPVKKKQTHLKEKQPKKEVKVRRAG